jgi:hypothetical protein
LEKFWCATAVSAVSVVRKPNNNRIERGQLCYAKPGTTQNVDGIARDKNIEQTIYTDIEQAIASASAVQYGRHDEFIGSLTANRRPSATAGDPSSIECSG